MACRLAPTLLTWADLPPLADVDGRDLSAAAFGRPGASEQASGPDAPGERAVYAETLATHFAHGWAPLFAIRAPSHLYVRAPRPELYDNVRDREQIANLFKKDPASARTLAEPYQEQIESVLAREREGATTDLTGPQRAQLEALGYLVPEGEVVSTGRDPKDGLKLFAEFDRAATLATQGRFAEAKTLAMRLLEEMPESGKLRGLFARIHLTERNSKQALEHAEAAVRGTPRSADHHVLLGMARLGAGETAKALEAFEAALELEPNHAEAHAGLMWKAKLGAPLPEVEAAAERALELEPWSHELKVQVARTWEELGLPERAEPLYRQAAELEPSNPSPMSAWPCTRPAAGTRRRRRATWRRRAPLPSSTTSACGSPWLSGWAATSGAPSACSASSWRSSRTSRRPGGSSPPGSRRPVAPTKPRA